MTRNHQQLILGIDTCGSTGGIALARLSGDRLETLAEAELAGKTCSARLLPAIRDRLAAHNLTPAALDAIVVTSGPGSFTGIRIGLSTAKGLAEVHSIPILAISRLAVLAHAAHTPAAALDANRGEFYYGEFSGHPGERLLTRGQFLEQASRLGENLAVCEDSSALAAPAAHRVSPPTAAQAVEAALPRLRARRFDDPVTLDGNYLRRSDAEIFSRPGVAIRSMESADLDAVAAIARVCPEAPQWTSSDYAALVAASSPPGPIRAGFVAIAGDIVGFAALRLVLDGVENRCELESIAVRPDARRHGAGAALLQAALDWAAKQGARLFALEVRAGNAAAIHLYERQGLRQQGRRPDYYAHPKEDALLFGTVPPAGTQADSISTAAPVERPASRC